MDAGRKNGYTVVELLVYMAIFTVASVVVIQGIIQLTSTFRLAQSEQRLAGAASAALDRLVREARLACDITAVSGLGDSVTFRTLPDHSIGQDCDISSYARTFALNSGGVIQDGDINKALTSSNVTVTNSDVFTEVIGAHQKALKIKLILASGTGQYQVTRTYNSMAVLRGSY